MGGGTRALWLVTSRRAPLPRCSRGCRITRGDMFALPRLVAGFLSTCLIGLARFAPDERTPTVSYAIPVCCRRATSHKKLLSFACSVLLPCVAEELWNCGLVCALEPITYPPPPTRRRPLQVGIGRHAEQLRARRTKTWWVSKSRSRVQPSSGFVSLRERVWSLSLFDCLLLCD